MVDGEDEDLHPRIILLMLESHKERIDPYSNQRCWRKNGRQRWRQLWFTRLRKGREKLQSNEYSPIRNWTWGVLKNLGLQYYKRNMGDTGVGPQRYEWGKKSRIGLLVQQYELLSMNKEESIKVMFTIFTLITNELRSLGKTYSSEDRSSKKSVEKFNKSLASQNNYYPRG